MPVRRAISRSTGGMPCQTCLSPSSKWSSPHGGTRTSEAGLLAEMPSTVIRNTKYDPATRTLSVWFVPTGHRYDYEDVDPETYAAFRKSSSKGVFFNEFIRDHH